VADFPGENTDWRSEPMNDRSVFPITEEERQAIQARIERYRLRQTAARKAAATRALDRSDRFRRFLEHEGYGKPGQRGKERSRDE
jgi:hypothetical protein